MGDLKSLVDANFNGQILSDLGEYVNYYSYSPTYDSNGYMTVNDVPTPSSVKVIIATFTQKDKEEYDLGNVSIDDKKGFLPSTLSPKQGDWITRTDGEQYKVLTILHSHAVGGIKNYHTVMLRRREP